MFDPKLIFSVLWLLQIALHLIFNEAFTPFEYSTWVVILLSLISFNFGAYTTLIFCNKKSTTSPAHLTDLLFIKKFLKYFLVIYVIAAAISSAQIYEFLSASGEGVLSLPMIRQLVIDDFTTDRVLYGIFKVFYLGVGFSIFMTAFSQNLTKKQLIIVLIIGLVSAIATTGRLYVLLFFCATSALLYRNKIISIRVVFIFALLFVFLFFIIAILLAKGDESGSVLENVMWNSRVYFMSSISCFNDFVATGAQHIDGGALLPNPIREILSFMGAVIPLKPALHPFAEVPVQCNTYTVFFPLFHDGSFFGIVLGLFLIGMMHQFLYKKYLLSRNPIWWYLYAISIYPLVMTVFEDAYFSSPGFWTLLWVPPICYIFFVKIQKASKSSFTQSSSN